jgi:hyperosmotically inducible protein
VRPRNSLIFGLVLAAVLAGGSSSSAAPSKAEKEVARAGHLMGNAGLTAKVKSALLADKVAPGMDINVNSNGGVVTLLGQVASKTQKSRAVQVTKQVAGVKKVVNKLTVATPAKAHK